MTITSQMVNGWIRKQKFPQNVARIGLRALIKITGFPRNHGNHGNQGFIMEKKLGLKDHGIIMECWTFLTKIMEITETFLQQWTISPHFFAF
jgi:hypothetical protein